MEKISEELGMEKPREEPHKISIIEKQWLLKLPPVMIQLLTISGPIITDISAGMSYGYSAVLLPQLEGNDSGIEATEDEISWIGSVNYLGIALGSMLTGVVAERYGRKMATLIFAIPCIVSWILMAVSTSGIMLIFTRALNGCVNGLLRALCPTYIAEVSEPKHRAWLLIAQGLTFNFGILLLHVLGTYLHWYVASGISAVVPAVGLLFLIPAIESPYWLVKKGRLEEAKHAFNILRGETPEAEAEFSKIVNKDYDEDKWKWKYALLPQVWKPFLIVNIYIIASEFNGRNVFMNYTTIILEGVFGGRVDEYLTMIVIDVLRLAFTVIACLLYKRFKVRLIIALSGYGVGVCLIILAALLYFLGADQSPIWVMMILLVGFVFFDWIAMAPLPVAMSGEMFPSTTRSFGTGLICSITYAWIFVTVKIGPDMMNGLGLDGCYLLSGCVAIIGSEIVRLLTPETKNRTLKEIESCFVGPKFSSN